MSGVGFVEGDPTKTVGARVLLALARVLEVLLLDLGRPGSVVRPYVDVVLRCLVTLFLGEDGSLAVRVGAETLLVVPVLYYFFIQKYSLQFTRRGQHKMAHRRLSEN